MQEIDDHHLGLSLDKDHKMLPRPRKPQILAQVVGENSPAALMMGRSVGNRFAPVDQYITVTADLTCAVLFKGPFQNLIKASISAIRKDERFQKPCLFLTLS